MRVIVCPDTFGGTLTALAAASAIADGWHSVAPDDEVIVRPLSDGGPGFVSVLGAALSGLTIEVPTVDPIGRPVAGTVLRHGDTGYVESADACGLHLLTAEERDPLRASSSGLGALVTAAAAGGREIVIGLGGSAVNDGGAGLLAGLGATPVDGHGRELPPGGAALLDCAGLRGRPTIRGVSVVGASDVDSPLTGPAGASAMFGPQKGATPGDVELLDAALRRWAGVLERDLPGCPAGLAGQPGGGAAGGLGAAILALGGRLVSGIGLVRQLTGLDGLLARCDIVITGEGSFDEQSLRGKVVAGVAAAAHERGVPCLVLAGRVGISVPDAAAAGITGVASLVEHFGSADLAMTRPAEGLRALAASAARRRAAP